MPMQYLLITWVYAAIPPAMLAGLMLRRGGRQRLSSHTTIATVIHGIVLGIGLAVLYSVMLHGHVAAGQYVIAAYGGIAMVSVLRLLNWGLARGLDRWLIRPTEPGTVRPTRGAALAGILRAVLLLVIGIPYVLSVLLVFRVKSVSPGTPASLLQTHYDSVTFTSADGIRLSGWWIPAMRSRLTDGRGPAQPGTQTVILCPGLGADQASQLFLVRDLVPNGYNVLSFDFRGTGQSGGQFTTFGDSERLDVLAAVHWLRITHPAQARRILGLGESTGAAALLGAAADAGPDGQAISAIALYNPYANLAGAIQSQCTLRAGYALGFLAGRLALPLAGAQVGANLGRYSPARDAEQIWPRPLLVIAGTDSAVIDFEQSRSVYDHAQPPKYSAWLSRDRQQTLHDATAAEDVRIFFSEARSIL